MQNEIWLKLDEKREREREIQKSTAKTFLFYF